MQQSLGFRFFVIVVVTGLLGWQAFEGVAQSKIQLGIDLQGGSELVFKFDFADLDARTRVETLKTAVGIIQQRVDRFGLKETVIQPIGDDRFSVQLSARDKRNVEPVKEIITVLGLLEFRILVTDKDALDGYWKRFQAALAAGTRLDDARTIPPEQRLDADQASGRYPQGLRWYRLSDEGIQRGQGRREEYRDNWALCRLDEQNLRGEHLRNITYGLDTSEGIAAGYSVNFEVEKLHQGAMATLTANRGDFMAIILNDRVDSAPVLQSTLSSNGRITGNFDEMHAKQLAAVLQAGALQQKPELVSESTIAPELAGGARNTGVWSTIISLGFVLLFMLWYYYLPGIVSNIALILNIVLLVGLLAAFGAVLTLPGIAGVVLTVGMAVDANILIYERWKEEKLKGKSLAQSLNAAYDRALVTIVDSNLTTLITAYFLFQMGSGPVRGFGITLTIGILVSMFTAIYVTRTVFLWALKRGWLVEGRMRPDRAMPQFDWMSLRRPAGRTSIVLILVGISVFALAPDDRKYDIDFTQGSKLVLRFQKPLRTDEVRSRLAALAKSNPDYDGMLVRVSAEGLGARIGADEGERFELRSQRVGTRRQIDQLVADLRGAFPGDLVPGPFKSTLEPQPGGKVAGILHFTRAEVTDAFLREAFRQYSSQSAVLEKAEIAAIPPPPGCGSAFRVLLDAPSASPGEIALHVRRSFDGYAHAEAILQAEKRSTDPERTMTEQEQAKEDLQALRKLEPLPEGFFDETDPFPLADRVDPSTAREHRDTAVKAILLSLFGIIAYVAFRFRSWEMGLASVSALIHDVLVTLGVATIANWLGIVDARLNLVTVAAYLTLVGYSINDTIVIFDRIRENRGASRHRLTEIINRSCNQTLSRSIRTSLTVLIVVTILFAMNYGSGSALVGFAFIMMFGAIVGAYSTIYIASPLLLFLPWMWRQCGSTFKSFSTRVGIVAAAATVALLLYDGLRGNLAGDASEEVFYDIVLGIPIALLGLSLFHFWRWLNIADPEKEIAAA
jgi:SecD/SecF fusion protein